MTTTSPRADKSGRCVCVQAVMVCRMLELEVQKHPEYPWMEDHFDAVALNVIQLSNNDDILGVGMMPMGRNTSIFPIEGHEAVIGLDTMNLCQVRCQVVSSVRERQESLTGGFSGLSHTGLCAEWRASAD
jgi:hypothetical protein